VLSPTLSDAAIIVGDQGCTSPLTGIKQSHGFPENLVLFSEVFIRTGEILQKCISNSTDFFSKRNPQKYRTVYS